MAGIGLSLKGSFSTLEQHTNFMKLSPQHDKYTRRQVGTAAVILTRSTKH